MRFATWPDGCLLLAGSRQAIFFVWSFPCAGGKRKSRFKNENRREERKLRREEKFFSSRLLVKSFARGLNLGAAVKSYMAAQVFFPAGSDELFGKNDQYNRIND